MKKHIYTIALSLLTAVTMVGCQEVYSPVDNIPVVETSAAENVGATRTTLCGVITKEAYDDFNFSYFEEQAPHYFFLLSEHKDLTDSTRVDARRDSDTCYAEVSGLAPATTYYYALCVANDYSMVMGEVQSLTTGKNTIIEVTTFGMVMEAVKEDRAPLDGSFKAETDCEAFFLLSETPTFENSRKIPANVNNGNCSAWAEGLTQGTTYYYKLSVFDQYNNTMEGEVQSFTTKEEVFVEITPDQITPGQLVDLGLSVMWAGWNVGATSPEGLGGYYAWGEIKEKDDYSEKSYLYYNMDKDSYVNIGNITGSDYDVAHVKWGGGWRMPTVAETEELFEHCTFRWASLEGTKGCHIIGPNGNSIFLPAAGYRNGTGSNERGSAGYYWSGTLDESYSGGAYQFNFYSDGGVQSWSGSRSLGYTVRPVYDINQIDESAVAEAIDLGLSVEWASWNVGATAPEEYGDYFAWGETSSYHNSNGITDDLFPSELESRGIIDADGNLTAAYDAATVNWGDEWRIPTLDEIQELLDRCTWSWTTQKGIYGRKIIGPNGNSIFLPAAGYHIGSSIESVGSYGGYWSATPNNDPVNAYYLNLKSGKSLVGRSIGGLTVRPVNAASKLNVSVTTGDATDISAVGATLGGIVSNSYKSLTCGIIYGTSSALSSTSGTMMSTTSSGEFSIEVTGLSPNTTYYYCSYVVVGDKYKYGDVRSFTTEAISITAGDAIDLGLSVKWASCNVGADSPEEYGDYYAWGETEEKNNYDWSTYKWGSDDYLTKYCFDPLYGVFDNKNYLEPEDDVAHVKRGDGWRMPTAKESFELAEKCVWLWISVNGVNGYLVTGPNGNSIFLPAAGCRYGTELQSDGTYGYYWTSSLDDQRPDHAWYHYGADYPEYHWDHYISRVYGLTVRPVTDGKRNNSDVDLDGYPEDENWDARRRR